MRTITKTLFYAQIAAMLVTAALASPSASGQAVPFRGSLAGGETTEFQGTTLFSHGAGTGNATHLGRFTATWETVAEPFGPINTGFTTFHFIAANGDSLFVEAPGQAEGTFPVFYLTETGTITGGTGRFDGATGSLLIEVVLVVTGADSDTVSGSFDGTIVMPKTK